MKISPMRMKPWNAAKSINKYQMRYLADASLISAP
jgi:hypothetical protein